MFYIWRHVITTCSIFIAGSYVILNGGRTSGGGWLMLVRKVLEKTSFVNRP